MNIRFQYQGALADVYTFTLIDTSNWLQIPWRGGLFVFAERAPEPLFFGEHLNLSEGIQTSPERRQLEESCRSPLLCYVLFEEDQARRKQILDDLAESYRPELNRPK